MGRPKVNRFSLGIELENFGPLTLQGGRWRTWFGRSVDDAEVVEMVHKNETEPRGSQIYTDAQLAATFEFASLLAEKYELSDVVGHDDVSPGPKIDPGPAFAMERFRARLLGRREDEPVICETTTNLNIRVGPGTWNAQLEESPLPEGTRVELVANQGRWRFVEVLEEVRGSVDVQGWVHGRYLRRVD